jgi:hypothetical protein
MSASTKPRLPALAGNHHALYTSRVRVFAYLLGMIAPMILMLVTGFLIIPTQWYVERSQNVFLINSGYAETLHNADCKILIYGDSTAMVDADPATIQKITGLSVCNIAEYVGVTVVNDTLLLDRYLSNNPKPKYLIFIFGPESYGPLPAWKDVDAMEALSYRFRFQRDFASSLIIVRHPAEVLGWIEHELRFLIAHPGSKPASPEIRNLRGSLAGRFPMSSPPLTSCWPGPAVEPRRSWIKDLRVKYGSSETKVVIDVSPLPACDTTFPFYRDQFRGVMDNEITQYPTEDYSQNGRYHMNSEGVLKFSDAIGAQINAERGR